MKTFFLAVLSCFAIALNSNAQLPPNTTEATTQFRSNSLRPDRQDSIGVTQTIKFRVENDAIQSLSIGWTKYEGKAGDETVIPIRLSVENVAKSNQIRVRGTVGLDILSDRADQVMGAIDVSIPLNRATLSGTIQSAAFLDNNDTVRAGLRQVQFSPKLDWRIDKANRLFVMTQYGWISDGNERKQVVLRFEHRLDDGVYFAGVVQYMDAQRSEARYWTPQNYLAVGPEIGYRFSGCQVGVRPLWVREDDKQDRFRVPFGGGCAIPVNSKNTIDLQVLAGYGVTALVGWKARF